MEPSFYHFAVLRYRPSYLLGEVVNIGVLFWFLEEGKFVFVAPTHLERLKSLYIAANLVNIRLGLKHFDLQAKILSSQKSEISRHIFDEKVLTEHFLLKDANAFTFSDWKKGDMNGKTSNELVEYHQKQYLYHYYKNHQTTPPARNPSLKPSDILHAHQPSAQSAHRSYQ